MEGSGFSRSPSITFIAGDLGDLGDLNLGNLFLGDLGDLEKGDLDLEEDATDLVLTGEGEFVKLLDIVLTAGELSRGSEAIFFLIQSSEIRQF